jgi:Kef-type K+ transport system membrane component KefB
MDDKIYEAIADRFYGISYGFLVPIFFATLSFHLHVNWTWTFWGFSLLMILAALIGKLVGAGGAARLCGYGFRQSAVVGIGMNSRGAVELVIATVVLETGARLQAAGTISEPLLTDTQFSVLVLTAFVTTLLTPLALKPAVLSSCTPDEHAKFCTLMDTAPRR